MCSRYFHEELSSRKSAHIGTMALLLMDYPDAHTGNIVGLCEKSIKYHRDQITAVVERRAEKFKQDKKKMSMKVKAPPLELPKGVKFLATVQDIYEESILMEHCVFGYADMAIRGECYLFHVDHKGEMATVEISDRGYLNQSYGPRNVTNKASKYAKRILGKWAKKLQAIPPPPLKRNYAQLPF